MANARTGMPDKVGNEWTPRNAETINKMFETLFNRSKFFGGSDLSDPSGILSLVPSIGDVIYGSTGQQFALLPIVGTAQRVLTNGGLSGTDAIPKWDQVSLTAGVSGKLPLANLVDASTTQRVLGRNSASGGVYEEVSLTQLLDWIGSAAQGDILYRGNSSWARLPAGTSGGFLQTLGAGANPAWAAAAIGGGQLYTGTGNPQGVLAASLGSFYLDAANGWVYQKIGGGSTVYGWYLMPTMGLYGPSFIQHWPSPAAVNTPLQNMGGGTGSLSGDGGTTYRNSNTFGGPYVELVTTTSAGTALSGTLLGSSSFMADAGNGYDWVLHIRTPASLTGMRLWVKVGQTNDSNSDTMGGNGLGFRYSTVAGDAGFTGVTRDGTTQATWGQVGGNIAANTNYYLRMRQVGTTGYLSVNDSTEVVATTNLPAAGTAVGLLFRAFNVTGGVGTARTLYWMGASGNFGGVWS